MIHGRCGGQVLSVLAYHSSLNLAEVFILLILEF